MALWLCKRISSFLGDMYLSIESDLILSKSPEGYQMYRHLSSHPNLHKRETSAMLGHALTTGAAISPPTEVKTGS